MSRPLLPELVVRRGRRLHISESALARTLSSEGPLVARRSELGSAGVLRLRQATRLVAFLTVAGLSEKRVVPEIARELRNVPGILQGLLVQGGPAAAIYGSEIAQTLASGTAIAVHAQLATAYDAGLNEAAGRGGQALARRVAAAERDYEQTLAALRAAAAAGAAEAALSIHVRSLEAAFDGLSELSTAVARASRRSVAGGRLGVRMSALVRRHAMVTAAALVLHAELREPKGARAAQRAAASAGRLRRREPDLAGARARLGPLDVGSRRTLFGRVARVRWFERPRKPFSVARLDNGALVYVPHKSMRGAGVGRGRHLVATGHVKLGKLGPYLEVEFEGPKENAKAVWEDWLAVLARPSYDLHPATLLMEWELSRLCRRAGTRDLLARLPRTDGA
jgi:hypothetical protein